MEFIETRAFTVELQRLAGNAADEPLRAIQSDLVRKPDRGVMVPGLGGIRKARAGNPAAERESGAVTATCICTWRRDSTFIS